MKDKLLQFLEFIRTKVNLQQSQEAMRFIIWYALLLVICCLFYVFGWGFDWYKSGVPNLPELRSFLHEIASSPWIAVIGFIAKAMVDNDNDGLPDIYESNEEAKSQKGNDEK